MTKETDRLMQVLQEVAAARHILIKCSSAEVDGFAFCSGLKALNLSNELPADLRARILSVTYLSRRTEGRNATKRQ
ncbi:hypothetical protein QBC32DRAFT_355266 [Pseudoneurospora amorphoporcata]|uniref:Uncharacterized protein n=1 Tax=Pseudoneurospora amorphoporcata TaxID=241081 RepID=A0AAN6NLR9_9PEZI|nr:hypothetical protein QBC32DRAFT_355266 [Pseudoneurospora amorphoporcata]